MNLIDSTLGKIKRFLERPISVFVFHHVSKTRDSLICAEEDWTQLDVFKRNLMHLKERYTFISLQEAIDHLQKDKIRLKDYAVLTADDGLRSTYEMLPWLIKQNIPITLFICPKYLDGHSYIPIDEQRVHAQYPNVDMTDVAARMFITSEQLRSIQSPLITIASHGYAHADAVKLTMDEFEEDVLSARHAIENHPLYQPFFAYTWGHHSVATDEMLQKYNLIPVLCDGKKNYTGNGMISRKCIDNIAL